MKTIFLAAASALALTAAAHAADALMVQPAYSVPVETPAYWTGFYAGVFGGVTSGDFDYDFGPSGGPTVIEADISGGGVLGGVQIGADYQFNSFVVGAVADVAITNHEADVSVSLGPDTIEASSTLEYLGTLRARAGFAYEDLLAYVHGGLAFGRTDSSIEFNGVSLVDTDAVDRFGFVIGAGVEYQVTDMVSIQTEYAYTDLGEKEIYDDGFTQVDEWLGFHTVKAGINFRF
ncbi:outer membrane protein [Devosia nitrariae]|uniref:Porin n=1 Tax=Devosia nitrariae TaxID=2071872 RepID=A0ABQ5WAA9_9HYPH|nr:outer membrane protein [Devosia nitrariae]GLQ56998.1 porin [Devosia nitrariae]